MAGVDARPILTHGRNRRTLGALCGARCPPPSTRCCTASVLGTVAQGYRAPMQDTRTLRLICTITCRCAPHKSGMPQLNHHPPTCWPSGVVAKDVPLVGVQHMISTYETLIKNGQLRRVDSVQLGYIGWYNRRDPSTLTLLPCWMLEGLLYDSAEDTGLLEGMDYPILDDHVSQVLVCAQTGQCIDWRTNKTVCRPAVNPIDKEEPHEHSKTDLPAVIPCAAAADGRGAAHRFLCTGHQPVRAL